MRAKKKALHIMGQRRFIRYSLLAINVVVLGSIGFFVWQSHAPSDTKKHSSVATAVNNDAPSDPLDQLSTADIAVNLAQMTHLAETESILWSNNITGNAIGVGAKLLIPPVTGIVYTVAAGDTPDSLATKFRADKAQIIAYNDAELSGLKVGSHIIVPNGQQIAAAPRTSYLGASTGAAGFAATYGYNGYDYGFCTWYVADRRAKIGRPLPSNLGDAWTWDDRSASAGIGVDHNPTVGAAVVTKSNSPPGHVAIVEAVNADGSVWISEMNSSGQRSMTDSSSAGGWGQVDFKLISADQARSYGYIH